MLSEMEHPFVIVLGKAGDRPYRKFVEYHMRRQSTEQLRIAGAGTTELLPQKVQDLTIEYIDVVNNELAYDKRFWDHADVKTAFGYIIQIAIRTLPIKDWIRSEKDAWQPKNHELAFNLFQLATLSFAYSASTQRKQRRFMSIRKGIFG